jgi:hypothetical protein
VREGRMILEQRRTETGPSVFRRSCVDNPPTYIVYYSFKNHVRNLGKRDNNTVFEIWKLVSREEYGSSVASRRRQTPIL